jgi:trans-2,3-dihydro-3-hydroxyanthranilate isomerase
MSRPFAIVDVFSESPLAGNQLAVIFDADDLADSEMLALAREFGYSETTFVCKPTDGSDWRVRIWTPFEEVPIAGHPLVGTALALHSRGMAGDRLHLETLHGQVPIEIDAERTAWMTQSTVEFGPEHGDPARLAAALSLDPSDLRDDLPCQDVSTGHGQVIVPIRSLEAIRRARPNRELWEGALEGFEPFIYCFTEETEDAEASAHCRLFAPLDIESGEDAASGGSAGPLACYLRRYAPERHGDELFSLEQGIEMGRPSRLRVRLGADGVRPLVGGQAAEVARGELLAP